MAVARYFQRSNCLSAAAATGAGTALNVRNFRHIIVSIATASSANLTVKCQGSIQETEPTWGSAASVTNFWDYVAMYNLQNVSLVAGDNGVVLTGTDDAQQFIVNTDGLEWVNFNVTARSAGSVTVKTLAIGDQ